MQASQKSEETRSRVPVTSGISSAASDTPEDGCEHQEDTLDGDPSDLTCGQRPRPRESSLSELALILLLVMGLQAIWFSPEIIRAVANSGEPRERVLLGSVQKVSFIGGLVPSTQVNTESQTLLLRGAASLPQGAWLERRKWWGDPEVCETQSGACWQLMSQ